MTNRRAFVFSDDFESDDNDNPDLRDLVSWDICGRKIARRQKASRRACRLGAGT